MAVPSQGASVPYQLFMLLLCVVSLTILAVDVAVQLPEETRALLQYADTAVCIAFFGDFLLSLRAAPNRWRYLYTWGWLDLISSIPTFDIVRWGRIGRIARVFRLLRGVRATKVLGSLLLAKRAESTFMAASLIAVLLVFAAGISILQVETAPESNIKTANDAVWWALTTITTVGYGDRFPVTPEGRFVAVLLMCAGVGLFGMFSGFLAAWFVEPAAAQERSEIADLREEVRQIKAILENRRPR